MGQLLLFGPVCVGKSTLLGPVADRLGRRGVDLDDVAEQYYDEIGYGRAELHEVGAAHGDWGAYEWWQQGHPHAVRRVLEDYPDAVIALGAGHTTYRDESLFGELREALRPHHPVLLLPSPDLERSVSELRERAVALNGQDWMLDGVDLLTEWVTGSQNRLIAELVVHVDGREGDTVADEIATWARLRLDHDRP